MIPFLIIFLIVLLILRHPVVKGYLGELTVRAFIGKDSLKKDKEKFVFNNYILQSESGKTTQIDHILINKFGIFVIETKNFSGRIYGDDFRKEWTQVLNHGKIKNHFYSPVLQNQIHSKRIHELFSNDYPIHSIIIFIKGNTRYISSKYVYTLMQALNAINHQPVSSITLSEMQDIRDILSNYDKSKSIKNSDHVKNINETKMMIENNICPRCNSPLIQRQGKYGVFLGCSNYPKCRYTKKI